MALPDLMDLVMHDPRRLTCLRAVAGEPGEPMPGIENLWRKPVFALTQAGQPTKEARLSLEDLIDRNRGIALIDGGSGPQPIDIPFTSIVVLTAEALPGAQELGRFLADRIEQRFRDVIDLDVGVTIHVEQSLHAAAPVAVYFGHGVHAPPQGGLLPHGEVIIKQNADIAIGQPIIGANTAGGLYPGQSRFAFSRSEMLTPAVHPDLPAGTIFFLGRYPVDSSARDAGGLPLLIALPQTPEARAQAIQVETLATPTQGGIDARFEILGIRPQTGRVSLGIVDVTLDRRPCRLHQQPPKGPHLAVLGLAIPENFGGRRMARYWVERSHGGRLMSSAMLAPRDSIVVQGRDARRYDRRELRYSRAGGEFRAESIGFDNRRRSVLMLEEGEFGYIALPREQTAISFGPDQSARGYGSFDWLGEAVRVQFGSGVVERLDNLYDHNPVGFIAAVPGGVAVQSAGDIWILGERKAQAAGTCTIPANGPFVLGPLVVELRGAMP
jgi:hypothetical protein